MYGTPRASGDSRKCEPSHFGAWGRGGGTLRHWGAKLEQCVRSGGTVWGPRAASAFFEMSARDPEGAAIFNAAMTSFTSAFDAAVIAAYDFSRFRTLVDVGGGEGALISSILVANPSLRGILFDIPPVIDSTRASCSPT